MPAIDVVPFTRSGPGLLLSVSNENGATVLGIRGEIDTATVPTLIEVLAAATASSGADVVVDLSQTDFIDSAAVRALAQAGQRLAERNRRLTIRSPSRLAARVLTIHNLFHLVEPGE